MHLCSVCHKEFKQKAALLQHGCIHTESRPFGCADCGKAFRQQSHLMQHKRIHTNEKPYGCVYCGRNFRQRTILNQHVRIHTGEKPYKCPQCGKDFRQKAILDQHVKTHQNHQLIPCSVPNCRRKFVTELEVKKHIEKHAKKLKKEVGCDEKTKINGPFSYMSEFAGGGAVPAPTLVKSEFYIPPYYPPNFMNMTPLQLLESCNSASTTSQEYRM